MSLAGLGGRNDGMGQGGMQGAQAGKSPQSNIMGAAGFVSAMGFGGNQQTAMQANNNRG